MIVPTRWLIKTLVGCYVRDYIYAESGLANGLDRTNCTEMKGCNMYSIT